MKKKIKPKKKIKQLRNTPAFLVPTVIRLYRTANKGI